MYIEKHFAIESPYDLAEALEGTYSDTDRFAVLYTQEPPQEAEQRFLYALMQKEGECILTANIRYVPSDENIEIYPGIFTNLKPVDGSIVADSMPTVDYTIKAGKAGGAEILFMSNITPKIIQSLLPDAKTVIKTVRKRYGAAHERGSCWYCAATDLIPEA